MKRRTLLLSGLGVTGALIVGWGVMPPRSRLGDAQTLTTSTGEVGLNGWIKIGADGRVMLAMARSEMGQGVHTALAMLVAEELDLDLEQVHLIPAGHDALYGNVAMFVAALPFHPRDAEPGKETSLVRTGQWLVAKVARELGINATGGSSSIADLWDVLRVAGASARAQLLGAAAAQWKLPQAELVMERGMISHAAGRSAGLGELAAAAAKIAPGRVTVKPREQWRLIGTAAPRTDIAAKSNGSAKFGIDVRLPGMRYAALRQCPMLGGSVKTFDASKALAMPGVEQVLTLDAASGSTAGLAVIARSHWHAQRAVQAIDVEWSQRPQGGLNSSAILVDLERQARDAARNDKGFGFHSRGDVAAAMKRAAKTVEAVYRAPYLAHATMEPINCTARVVDGRVEVWVPTQVPGQARAIAAKVAGVNADRVTVHVTYLGGGFGRRLEVDVVAQAVSLAMRSGGQPVQLLWSREEDTTHDFYRPAAVAVLRAGFDDNQRPIALTIHSAGDAITPRWLERTLPALAVPFDLPDKTSVDGLFGLPYAVPHQRMAHVATRSGVPIGLWRSVGHSHNAFFSESFIDELAHAAEVDPLAFRLDLLAESPRHAAVLQLAGERSGWEQPLPAGRARGVALHESFESIVAQVVEVSLEQGKPRVHRVVCAIDCGSVVNPGIVAQQMESGIVFGLTAALHGRIDIVNGVVQQRNFDRYRLMTLADLPRIQTHIVPSTNKPGGVGEPGVPPIAPALANALFILTGQRLRELPLTLA